MSGTIFPRNHKGDDLNLYYGPVSAVKLFFICLFFLFGGRPSTPPQRRWNVALQTLRGPPPLAGAVMNHTSAAQCSSARVAEGAPGPMGCTALLCVSMRKCPDAVYREVTA